MNNTALPSFIEDSNLYKTIPIVKEFIVDTLTPIQIFQNLKEEATFLLESKDEESSWSRFSFIGLRPYLYIEEKQDGLYHIKDGQRKTIFTANSFKKAFSDIQEKFLFKTNLQVDVPFTGGAVGYIGYDEISTIEKVKKNENDGLQFNNVDFMFCETIIAYDHQTRKLIMIHYVRLNGTEDLSTKTTVFNQALAKINEYIHLIMENKQQQEMFMSMTDDVNVSFENVRSNYQKDDFMKDVLKIKEYIKAGDIFQAVLSQRFEVPISVSGFQLYRVLRTVNPSPYLFYIKIGEVEMVGSSPERLIKIEDGMLEIHPIAGTRRRGHNQEEDKQLGEELLNDEKERAEHYMLVDLARNDIGRVAKYGSVKTPTLMKLGHFSHVMHLISKVTGELADHVDPIDALLASFPAGTVSGAPKIRAMQIINELEPTARNIYAGTVAYIGLDGNIDSCITIRTMIIKNNTAYVQAGAGVVADSIPELEWKETRNKASALIKAINIAHETFQRKEDTQHV